MLKVPLKNNLPHPDAESIDQIRINQLAVETHYRNIIHSDLVIMDGASNVPGVTTGFFDAGRHIANQDHFFQTSQVT
jgi:hypothetical protein